MIQIILSPNSETSLEQACKQALAQGFEWLIIDSKSPKADDDIRRAAEACRDAGVILTVLDNPGLAEAIGAHGVYLRNTAIDPIALRQQLGAEPIIGAAIASADQALRYEKADIDYVTIDASNPAASEIIKDIRVAGGLIQVVAYKPIMQNNDLDALLMAGFSGACTESIANS